LVSRTALLELLLVLLLLLTQVRLLFSPLLLLRVLGLACWLSDRQAETALLHLQLSGGATATEGVARIQLLLLLLLLLMPLMLL
jgi:hypothetical protein